MRLLDHREGLVLGVVQEMGVAGDVLHDTELFGAPIVLSVRVDIPAHERRHVRGERPETDGRVLATWEWPEFTATAPAPVVSVCAALAVNASWRSGLRVAARWSGFGPAAVVNTRPCLTDQEQRSLECLYRGVGCVDVNDHGLTVRVPPSPGRVAGTRRRTLDRWVEESIYAELVARQQLS